MLRAAAWDMNDYKELIVWQIADALRVDVYGLIERTAASRDTAFANQLRRSVSGISSNIVEGFRRFGPSEFARALDIAYAEAGETANWLEDGIRRGYWTERDVDAARLLLRRLNPGLMHLTRYLRSPTARARAQRGRTRT